MTQEADFQDVKEVVAVVLFQDMQRGLAPGCLKEVGGDIQPLLHS